MPFVRKIASMTASMHLIGSDSRTLSEARRTTHHGPCSLHQGDHGGVRLDVEQLGRELCDEDGPHLGPGVVIAQDVQVVLEPEEGQRWTMYWTNWEFGSFSLLPFLLTWRYTL
jgi:hypothetical protein